MILCPPGMQTPSVFISREDDTLFSQVFTLTPLKPLHVKSHVKGWGATDESILLSFYLIFPSSLKHIGLAYMRDPRHLNLVSSHV